jgi:CubicO group peptidase (beta-lactamase class C family)
LPGMRLLVLVLPATMALSVPLFAQKGYFTANGQRIQIVAFDREIRQMLDDIRIPGVSLAIIDGNEVVYSHAYGYKRLPGKKVDQHTVFEACSLSKSYLVYVAFRLVDEGKLDLDKPMYEYVDPGPFLSHDPRYKLITSRMVLSHCSGLENWKEDNNRDTMEILANPGEKFIYSSTGYNWLAAVIEKLLGESYHDYVTKMLLQPFRLDHSYLEFKRKTIGPFHTESPSDYANGYNAFGSEFRKWKNREAVASSGNNITAGDYARLIITIFNGKNLSAQSIRTLISPGIPTNQHGWPNYYGPGFEVFYIGGDTIIAHGGNNPGFKAQVFYSVVKKRGFVFLTNSDRGKLMTERLNGLTVGLDIHQYYEQFSREQYPNPSIDLFKVYMLSGEDAMWREIDRLKAAGKLGPNTLSELGDVFIDHDAMIARRLITENIILFPEASLAYAYLGDVYAKMHRYDSAVLSYLKANDLQFPWWSLDSRLANCRSKQEDLERRSRLVTELGTSREITIQAENYNNMNGVDLFLTSDSGVVHTVGNTDLGDWMDYKLNVASAGIYRVNLRVSCPMGGRIELLEGGVVRDTIKISPTKHWNNWEVVSANIGLAAGIRTIRLYAAAGGYRISWLRFARSEDSAKR